MTNLNCESLTTEQLIKRFTETYMKSKYKDLSFNNRPFEPFHLLSVNNNYHDVRLIDDNVINYYLHKEECFYCTGPWLIRPMSCYDKPECKLNFRYNEYSKKSENEDEENGETKIRAFIETRQDKTNPYSVFISRYLLVANYYYKFPAVVRTPTWLNACLHHLNEDSFDDRFGNHTFVDKSVHTGTHSKIRNINNEIDKLNLYNYEKSIEKLNELKKERQSLKFNLVNSRYIFEVIYHMKDNFFNIIDNAKRCADYNKTS